MPKSHCTFKVEINVGDDNSAINYILIGGNNYFQTGNPSVKPFYGLDLGCGLGIRRSKHQCTLVLLGIVKAGVKIKASDVVAVEIQGYFQTIWASYGVDTYYYPGWGTVDYPENSSTLPIWFRSSYLNLILNIKIIKTHTKSCTISFDLQLFSV